MRHLFENWGLVGPRLRAAPSIALFLDFDGTLAPVRARPELAAIDGPTRRALRCLANSPRVHVCVISGRRLEDIRKRVRVPGVILLGLHGWDRDSPNRTLSACSRVSLASARREISARLPPAGAIWIEDKGATFSIHYRGAPSLDVREARVILDEVLDPLGGVLRVLLGDLVWEVVPREVRGKGAAAQHRFRNYSRALPVYAGNDATDESAFHALAGGVTIRVGPVRPSRARFSLRSPAEVRQLLERILDEMQ